MDPLPIEVSRSLFFGICPMAGKPQPFCAMNQSSTPYTPGVRADPPSIVTVGAASLCYDLPSVGGTHIAICSFEGCLALHKRSAAKQRASCHGKEFQTVSEPKNC